MPQILWIFLPLLAMLNWPCHVECGYRKNYVVERNESWNGHVYLVREVQPFFRVYHQTHTKVLRDNPNAGKLNPIQAQLVEEKGSDQRLRMAAQFWHEHNKAGHQRNRRADPGMDWAVDEKAMGTANDFAKTKSHQNNHGMGREGVEQPMEEMMTASQSPSPLSALPTEHQQEELEMQVFERNQNRSSAKFGHHHLPTGERKDSVNWPGQLFPYMHCLSMECVCPLFRGKMRGNHCILPNGKPLERAVRKEFRQYTREELALFMEVMHRFKASGLYSRLGMIHRRSGVHSGPSFFPWHREFLKRLEIVFRALHPENSVPTLGLPYWDSTLDGDLPAPEDSIMFSQFLLGEPDDSGFVTTGLFANWTTMDGRHSFQRMFGDQPDGEFFNEARIDFVLSQTQVERVMAFSLPLQSCLNYEMDDRFLEYSHDYVHYFISGDMQERFSSSNDPIFFMHHGFVDSIWELWRQKRQSRLQRERDYPRDDGECMPEWHYSYAYMPLLQPLRNMDALSNNYTDNMYEYAPRPSCAKTGRSEECGNTEFLWCDTQSHAGNPVCSAKVKPGGNCRGFEWSSEVCYQGQCLEGRCSRPLDESQRTKMDAAGGWQSDSFMRK